ncbi:MAG TPA: hypothetical protein VHZ32_16450, partial [Rhizomicrobium sp.]|nr:hypothetical protein [Rhizomicrobium sp.]
QAGFLLLVLLSPSHSMRPAGPARETLLFFPPLAVPAPSTIDARGARRKRIAPSDAQPLPPIASPPVAASPLAPLSGLAGFGQALFGCAPEHYADLTPDQRAHCPKPGEGLANKEQPDLMGTPSHVKDNARWANAMAHKQTLPMLPGGMLFPLVALGAVLDGSIVEPNSAFRDPEQWPAERDPGQFMPRSPAEQEKIYADWNREHAARAPDCVATNKPADTRAPCPASPSVPASAASPASAAPP